MKRPASQFYWADWLRDPGIRASSLEARGLWMDVLSLMHEGEPYGHLTVGAVAVTDTQLARMVGESPGRTRKLLKELETNGVFSRTDKGVIYSRRMVRDERLRDVRIEAGKMGGNPKLTDNRKDKALVNQKVKGGSEKPSKQNLTPSSSSSASTSKDTTGEYAFMGLMRPVWRGVFGGDIPPGSAKRLKPAIGELGAEEVARRLAIYCEATDPQYASIQKFVSTIGGWGDKNGDRLIGVGGEPTIEELESIGIRL